MGAGGTRQLCESVAVATHSVFLLALTTGVLHFEDPTDPRMAYFQTGEMRTYQIRVERVGDVSLQDGDVARPGGLSL